MKTKIIASCLFVTFSILGNTAFAGVSLNSGNLLDLLSKQYESISSLQSGEITGSQNEKESSFQEYVSLLTQAGIRLLDPKSCLDSVLISTPSLACEPNRDDVALFVENFSGGAGVGGLVSDEASSFLPGVAKAASSGGAGVGGRSLVGSVPGHLEKNDRASSGGAGVGG